MSGFDLVVRRARLPGRPDPIDLGLGEGRVLAIEPTLPDGPPSLDAEGLLVVPGLVETHIHLDKTCILDRCTITEGTLAEAVRETGRAKAGFTPEDVLARGRRTLARCIAGGTMRMRSHVELDPGIGLIGFEAVQALAREHAWALDLELCVFPQEGLTNRPGTEELLREGLRRGARAIGAAPYVDPDPRGQIDRVFALAREFDAEIDMHLDLLDGAAGMQAEYVCRQTEAFGWGGRVAIGHVTGMSFLPRPDFDALGARLAGAGVAVTVLPATDLFLMGRGHDHAVPRGVLAADRLLAHGVNCSLATNNVLNPFTPYGDGSLIRMANLFANVCHVASPDGLAECLGMVTERAARLLRRDEYGLHPGGPADLVLLDAPDPAAAVAELAQPLWGLKAGRMSFRRDRPVLLPP